MSHYADMTFMLFDTGIMNIIDKIIIFCSDVNKTSTFNKLLAINIARYMS